MVAKVGYVLVSPFLVSTGCGRLKSWGNIVFFFVVKKVVREKIIYFYCFVGSQGN
jgi:hypothetical protein